MSGQQHSMAYIKVDGTLLATMPGAKIDLGGQVRTSVVGDNRVHGHSSTLKPGMLECEISLSQGYSLDQLRNITNATVTYEADTGQTYVIREAFVTETLNVTAGEGGKVALKFEGQPAEEMLA
jgi:hypothetical protein